MTETQNEIQKNTEDPSKDEGKRINLAPVVGVVAGLMMESPMHRHLFINDLEWLVLPPILLGQYRIFRKDGVPVAYASWAKVTEEKEQLIKDGVVRLRPDEWSAGERTWLIDLVAPFGGEKQVLNELKRSEFKDCKLNVLDV